MLFRSPHRDTSWVKCRPIPGEVEAAIRPPHRRTRVFGEPLHDGETDRPRSWSDGVDSSRSECEAARSPAIKGARNAMTGKGYHDRDVVTQIYEVSAAEEVRSVRTPVILAGGLGPDNVAEAIRVVCPAGVDSI